MSDDYRSSDAFSSGGFPLNDKAVIQKYRNAIKGILSQLGSSIMNGKFNLAGVSFPISCMYPCSIL
jgi:hypothetical protein